MKRFLLVLPLAVAMSAVAQSQSAGTGAVALSRDLWHGSIANVTKAAEQMSEADFAYKPTPDVRSFGQLIGHIAGSQHMFCGAALGEAPSAEDDIEKKNLNKADLVAALRTSTAHCEKAYALSDDALQGTVKMFGGDHPKLWTLLLNMGHVNEHYGNIATYMRLKGLIPPSSQPRK